MDWGDVPGWAALLVSVLAAVIAWKARSDGSRSADAAEQSANEARRSADAAERSAHADEQALADQRRAAQEEREAAELPRIVLERVNKNMFCLRNVGGTAATGIKVTDRDDPPIRTIENLTLAPEEAHQFMMAGSMAQRVPPQIWVIWDGLADAVSLPVPS